MERLRPEEGITDSDSSGNDSPRIPPLSLPFIGSDAMPQNIQCPHCGVVLTMPEGAMGRRLKCPKCNQVFQAGAASTRPPSQAPGVAEARPTSSSYATPTVREKDIHTSEGPLRDLFDLPLLNESQTVKIPPKGAATAADAMALFRDDPPPQRKKPAGDARKTMRRCQSCGGVVPAGMSICSMCGLDQETGIRVGFDEDLETVPTHHHRGSMPMSVMVTGILMITLSLGLSVAALIGFTKGNSGSEYLLVICLFGLYASVQLLRMKSVKLLFVALTLGVMIDVIAMIGLPIYNAVTQVETVQGPIDQNDAEDEGIRIKSLKESLDINRLSWGIAIVFSYAAVSVFLNSPPVRRHFERR